VRHGCQPPFTVPASCNPGLPPAPSTTCSWRVREPCRRRRTITLSQLPLSAHARAGLAPARGAGVAGARPAPALRTTRHGQPTGGFERGPADGTVAPWKGTSGVPRRGTKEVVAASDVDVCGYATPGSSRRGCSTPMPMPSPADFTGTRSRSCRSSPVGSTPRSFPAAVSARPCGRLRAVRRFRSSSTSRRTRGSLSRSRSRRTTSPRRPWRTRPSMRRRRGSRCRSPRATAGCSCRSATTGSAEPIPRAARAWSASPTASRRWAGRSKSAAVSATGRTSPPSSHSSSRRRRNLSNPQPEPTDPTASLQRSARFDAPRTAFKSRQPAHTTDCGSARTSSSQAWTYLRTLQAAAGGP
jgi:hypothetical protein